MGNSLDKILPGLYVGGIRASSKEKILNENRITHILSIHDRAAPVFKDRQYLCIVANDNAGQDLTQYFEQCNDFIHQARLNGGSVLVHCFAGISRSVTVTTAYIMTITDLSWREALKAIRGARNCANPNFGFQRQLLAFYHDSLLEEKKRLFTKFPKKLEFDDEKECRRLIHVHEQWIMHGDEGIPTADIEDENIYPLQHNAYGIQSETMKNDQSTESKISNKADDDDDDDDAYIDMSKNSFKKSPTPKSEGLKSIAIDNSEIPSCSADSVRQYEDKLLSDTAKFMAHEKYHKGKHSDEPAGQITQIDESKNKDICLSSKDQGINVSCISHTDNHDSKVTSRIVDELFSGSCNKTNHMEGDASETDEFSISSSKNNVKNESTVDFAEDKSSTVKENQKNDLCDQKLKEECHQPTHLVNQDEMVEALFQANVQR